jgi:hypothetical protein
LSQVMYQRLCSHRSCSRGHIITGHQRSYILPGPVAGVVYFQIIGGGLIRTDHTGRIFTGDVA